MMRNEKKQKVMEITIFISEDGTVSDNFGYSHNFLKELKESPLDREIFITEFFQRLNQYIDDEIIEDEE